jgi:hypothetical protein
MLHGNMRKSLYINSGVVGAPERAPRRGSILGGMSRKPGGEVKVAAA